jgi:hypothetical protein
MIRSGLKIVLNQAGRQQDIYSATGDLGFTLAEVYWSPDGKSVGIFTCGEPLLRIAVDRKSTKQINFAVVEGPIRNALRKRYNVPADQDVFRWVCFYAGTDRFREAFGDGTTP